MQIFFKYLLILIYKQIFLSKTQQILNAQIHGGCWLAAFTFRWADEKPAVTRRDRYTVEHKKLSFWNLHIIFSAFPVLLLTRHMLHQPQLLLVPVSFPFVPLPLCGTGIFPEWVFWSFPDRFAPSWMYSRLDFPQLCSHNSFYGFQKEKKLLYFFLILLNQNFSSSSLLWIGT